MFNLMRLAPALLVAGAAIGMIPQQALAQATHVKLQTFQIPEVVPNTALANPEEVTASSAVLVRGKSSIMASIATTGVPSGTYTFWWHLAHDDGEVSILWAGNAIVRPNEVVQVVSVLPEGEANAPGYIFIGHGLQEGAANSVTVQLWVRTHGAMSEDPDILERQLTRPFGGCTDTRNPLPEPTDYPCWNPQRAIF